MSTTSTQIEAMQEMARRLTQDDFIFSAHVDDWGRDGNFTLMVTPVTPLPRPTLKLKAKVRRNLPENAVLRECFSPEVIYKTFYTIRRNNGLSRSYWIFDIDFKE